MSKSKATFPIPPKIPVRLVKHGIERIDSYHWMADKKNKDVIKHLKAENNYTKAILSSTKPLQKELYAEMKKRIKEDDSSAPYLKNGYWYYVRYIEGEEYGLYCRKAISLDNQEEVLLDENELATDYDYYDLDSFAISKNNKILAFAEDLSGRNIYQIRFKDLETNKISTYSIENCESEFTWHADNETLYYIEKDLVSLRPYLLKTYNIRTKESEIIYEELDETFSLSIDSTGDFKYIFMGCHSALSTEFHFKPASDSSAFIPFIRRSENHEYYPEWGGDCFFIKTNLNAKNFKLVKCSIENRDSENWVTIQEHNPSSLIEDFEVFEQYIVLQEKVNGLSQLRVYDRRDFSSRLIPPTEETYTLFLENNPESNSHWVRIGYSSMTTPFSIYDINLVNFDARIIKQAEVLGHFDSSEYQSERIWAKTEDGVEIPISLVYKKSSFKRDGKNPILIYGYGAYGSTIDPYFSSIRLSLLDRGFVFAIAHVRGGEYLGTRWYEDGKLMHKKNSFTDFIAATDHLITQKYADSSQVYATGGSAGGLLMAAVANLRPELWKALILDVPFVDVVTTMLNESLPLTIGEYDEWGNPNELAAFKYMLSYSPYDQLEAKSYPHIFVSSGVEDGQVQYWEPTKYVAKLRELKTNENLVLLKTNLKAGHGGASGRYEQLKETAEEYAFILAILSGQIGS